MTIKSTAHPAIPLFYSVDSRWDGNGWVFSFLPQLTAEANACVAGLLPYLRYLVGPELHSTVEKSFTAEAVERSAQSFADAGKVVSPTDALVDHTLDANLDYDFTALALLNPDGTTQAVVSAGPVHPAASGTPVWLPALGEDSVSTFGTQGGGCQSRYGFSVWCVPCNSVDEHHYQVPTLRVLLANEHDGNEHHFVHQINEDK